MSTPQTPSGKQIKTPSGSGGGIAIACLIIAICIWTWCLILSSNLTTFIPAEIAAYIACVVGLASAATANFKKSASKTKLATAGAVLLFVTIGILIVVFGPGGVDVEVFGIITVPILYLYGVSKITADPECDKPGTTPSNFIQSAVVICLFVGALCCFSSCISGGGSHSSSKWDQLSDHQKQVYRDAASLNNAMSTLKK